tara:strand:- start:1846 stop:2991 length:1146 start_codon:yes stop_codon:yes gene_type:complete
MEGSNIKKIVVATPLYPPEQGGPRTYTLMLEDELSKYGFEVRVVPFARARKWPKVLRHVVYCWMLLKAARKADLVYALDPVSVGLPAMIASKLSFKKFIIRIPGDYAWEQGQIRFGVTDTLDEFVSAKNKYSLPVYFMKKVQSLVTKQAEVAIVPSQYMKKIVSTWGMQVGRIIPIYTSLRRINVEKSREVIRRDLGFNGTVILSIARLTPWKGLLTLIELLPEIKKTIPDAKLVIVGEGPEKQRILDLAKKLELGDSFMLFGPQSKTGIGEITVGADIFVLNTAYEGLSHQLLETMDLGTPIITTNVGGNPELIKSEKDGILVEYDDSASLIEGISRIATDNEFRNKLTRNAKEKSGEFDQKNVVNQLIDVLNSLITENK